MVYQWPSTELMSNMWAILGDAPLLITLGRMEQLSCTSNEQIKDTVLTEQS